MLVLENTTNNMSFACACVCVCWRAKMPLMRTRFVSLSHGKIIRQLRLSDMCDDELRVCVRIYVAFYFCCKCRNGIFGSCEYIWTSSHPGDDAIEAFQTQIKQRYGRQQTPLFSRTFTRLMLMYECDHHIMVFRAHSMDHFKHANTYVHACLTSKLIYCALMLLQLLLNISINWWLFAFSALIFFFRCCSLSLIRLSARLIGLAASTE